jgi:hypothetical protein
VLHHFRWHHDVPVNDANPDTLVNVLEYWEISAKGHLQYFRWIIDLPLTADTVYDIMRGVRARFSLPRITKRPSRCGEGVRRRHE